MPADPGSGDGAAGSDPGLETGLLLGIDGGGSGSRARLADRSGRTLAEASDGPANLTTGFDGAVAALRRLTSAVFSAAGHDDRAAAVTSAVFGVAGASALQDGRRLRDLVHPFRHLAVVSDTEIACAGAHGGSDGGMLVLGTGSQAYGRVGGRTVRIGGWGFALSDGGSGALLGRAAMRRSLSALEEIEPGSAFTRAVTAGFGHDPVAMLQFALRAAPKDFAALAPLVFDHAEAGDPIAAALVDDAVREVEALIRRLAAEGVGRIALAGGLASRYRPRLALPAGAVLTAPVGDALAGAILLARSEEA